MNIQSAMASQGKIVGLAAITIAIGALAACSGGSSPSSKASDPAATTVASADSASTNASDPAAAVLTARKPCDLLTREDAEAAVGQPLPKKTEILVMGSCDYSAEDVSAGAGISVGSWEQAKAAATSGSPKPVAMSGVGDEALALKSTGGVYVRKGDKGLHVAVFGPKINAAGDYGLAESKELALKIIGKF